MTQTTTAIEALKAAAAKLTTAQLLDACDLIEAKATTTSDERLVRAAMSDVIEERHDLAEAMDAIYADVDYDGTYTAALRAALATQAGA